jgi:hypothetical protein
MNTAELLSHPLFDLPVSWVGHRYTTRSGEERECRSYHDFIIHQLDNYQLLLEQLTELEVDGRTEYAIRVPPVTYAQELQRTVRVLCLGILAALRDYANGSPSRAYHSLAQALDARQVEMGGQIWPLMSPPSHHIGTWLEQGDQVFYRLRRSSKPLTRPRDLFHLPFELRWRTRGFRFSIAGYPSLYAATSPLLALRELRLTEWPADMYAVRLRAIPYESMEIPKRQIRFLDLRNSIATLRARYAKPGPYAGEALRFLVRWPLVMATSVPVGHSDEEGPGFHEEYVLPQLLLEWVNNERGRQHKITGIMYSSSRVLPTETAYTGHYNIVVPAEQPAATGLCSVRVGQFEVSPPLAVGDLLSPAGIGQEVEAALNGFGYQRLRMDEPD